MGGVFSDSSNGWCLAYQCWTSSRGEFSCKWRSELICRFRRPVCIINLALKLHLTTALICSCMWSPALAAHCCMVFVSVCVKVTILAPLAVPLRTQVKTTYTSKWNINFRRVCKCIMQPLQGTICSAHVHICISGHLCLNALCGFERFTSVPYIQCPRL